MENSQLAKETKQLKVKIGLKKWYSKQGNNMAN